MRNLAARVSRLEAELALAENGGGGPSVGPMTTFVLDTTATARDNVFTTWASLVVSVIQVAGPKRIEIRDATFAVADGTYNLGVDPIEFVGLAGGSSPVALSFSASAVLTGPAYVTFDGVSPIKTGADPLFDSSTVGFYVFTNGSTPQGLIARSSGTGFSAALLSSDSNTSTGATVFQAKDTSGFNVVVEGNSTISQDTVARDAGATLTVISNDASSSANLNQAGIPGGLLTLGVDYMLDAVAQNVGYLDNAPVVGETQVQGALDALKRCAQSFSGASGAVGPAASGTLITLAAIDVNANEALVIEACATFNKDATPDQVLMAINIDGNPVDNAGASNIAANEAQTISRVVQVKPAAGNRVVTLTFGMVAGQASVVAGGAQIAVRRVLA